MLKDYVEIFKSLSNETRLRVLNILYLFKEKTVSELCADCNNRIKSKRMLDYI